MGLDILIPLLLSLVCLLPNLFFIWLARRLKLSQRLGIGSLLFSFLSLLAAFISYAEINDNTMLSLVAAIAGAIMAIVAIDYFRVKEDFYVSVFGVGFYFLLLCFCEITILGITGHM